MSDGVKREEIMINMYFIFFSHRHDIIININKQQLLYYFIKNIGFFFFMKKKIFLVPKIIYCNKKQ